MKKSKKCLKGIAIFLSAAIALNLLNGFVRIAKVRYIDREPTVTEKELRFNEDGKFTVLQLADLQDNVLFKGMSKEFINAVLDETKPDLVVLTGDNIGPGTSKTADLVYLSIHEFMSIFEERGIKVAAVFGNHDEEDNAYDKGEQIEVYKKYSCYVGSDVEGISGSGNYNLPVLSSKGDETAFNFWFFDSGEYNDENDLGGYGCVHKDQIEWYVNTEKELTKENGGKPVPSLAFQHIIVPEVYDVLEKVENPEDEKYKDRYVAEFNGNYYAFPEEYTDEDTFFSETACPPNYTNGQADAFIENGNVLGIAVGHDHKNSFVIPYKSLDIINTSASSFGSYGDMNRGARVFVLDEKDTSAYETDVIFMRDIFDMDDPFIYVRYLLNNDGGNFNIPGLFSNGAKYIAEKIKSVF